MEYIFVPKGNYVFIQNEWDSKRFYGIIKGRISIRTKKVQVNFTETKETTEPNTHNDPRHSNKLIRDKLLNGLNISNSFANKKSSRKMTYLDLFKRTTNDSSNGHILDQEIIKSMLDSEVENMQITDGMCFGEWSLLNGRPRSASAYTLEDTHLFYLEKEAFDLSLSKALLKGDYEKKNFLTKRLHHIIEGTNKNINYKFYAIYLDCNEVLYTEVDKPKFIYFIYEGECKLAKSADNRGNNKNFKTREEIINNKHKLITHLKLGKGAIAGLEAITGGEYYEYNLISSRDCTILLKVNLDDTEIMNKENIAFLKEVHKEQINHINEFKEKYIINKNKSCIEFKEKNKNEVDSDKEKENIENLEEEIRNMNKKQANISKNNVKLFHLIVNKKRVKSLGKLKINNSHEDLHNKNNKIKTENLTATFYMDNLFKTEINFNSSSKRKTGRLNTENKNIYLSNIKNESLKRSIKEPHPNLDSPKHLHILSTDATSKLSLSTKVSNLIENIPTSILKTKAISNNRIKEMEINGKDVINESRQRKFTMYKPTVIVKYDTREKSKDNLRLNKDIQKTVNLWNKLKCESVSTYDSGVFSLPLLSMNK